jgi:hypothetical protein
VRDHLYAVIDNSQIEKSNESQHYQPGYFMIKQNLCSCFFHNRSVHQVDVMLLDNCSCVVLLPSIHGHMHCPTTTTTDGGSADIASLHGCNLVGQCRSNYLPVRPVHMRCPTNLRWPPWMEEMQKDCWEQSLPCRDRNDEFSKIMCIFGLSKRH